jgi:thioredoxin reductase (NADPH)
MGRPSFKFYGAHWCQDCHALRKFLGEHRVEYEWYDIDRSRPAAAEVKRLTGGGSTIPVLAFSDGTVLVNPDPRQLATRLNFSPEPATDYDELAIIGAGPTGLSAAIYTTRDDIKTTLYEKKVVGGLASITDMIDNYPGFPDGVSGLDLSAAMEKQAQRFGAGFKLGVEVTGLAEAGRYQKVSTSAGERYAKAVLLAVGTDYRKLGVPGEAEFTSRGVHYCATCDGPLYKDKTLIVVGGGNSAMQEGLFLTRFARKVTLLVRGDNLRGTEFLINKVTTSPKIEVNYGVSVKSIAKEAAGMTVTAENGARPEQFQADGIFVLIGLNPNTSWLDGVVDLDDRGFINTSKTFETSRPGVFAAGDARSGATLQIASAVGEGVAAALMIREYLKEKG